MWGAVQVQHAPVWHVRDDFQKINVFADKSFGIRGEFLWIAKMSISAFAAIERARFASRLIVMPLAPLVFCSFAKSSTATRSP
jgi:hypothetical protein